MNQMKVIDKREFTPIGTIQKPHGLKGEVVLLFEESFDESLEEAEILFIEIEGGLVPFFISEEGLRFRTSDSAIVQFDELDSQEKAKDLGGSKVYLHNEEIFEQEEEGTLSYLNGFIVFDKKSGKLGPVIQIDDFAGNIVITVEHGQTEVLIPLSDNIIENIDEHKKELFLDCPEGLIELYLE